MAPWTAHAATGAVSGYVVDWPPPSLPTPARHAWRHACGPGRLLAAVPAPPPGAGGARPPAARVLGDRSMKLRLAADGAIEALYGLDEIGQGLQAAIRSAVDHAGTQD
jgi:hypothetical protein